MGQWADGQMSSTRRGVPAGPGGQAPGPAPTGYAQVLVFQPIRLRMSLLLDYAVPPALSAEVSAGVLVVVPLRTQVLPGIVMGITGAPSVPDVREIISVLDPEPALGALLLDLAHWISRETLTPLHLCVQQMLPPGLRPQAYLKLTPKVTQVPADLPKPAARLLELLLERGPLTSPQLLTALKGVDIRRARITLKRKGVITVERLLRMPRVSPKTVPMVQLAVDRAGWDEGLAGLQRTPLYRAVLEFLEEEGDLVEVSVVRAETGAGSYHVGKLEERGLITTSRQEVIRDPLEGLIFMPDHALQLTPGQLGVWRELGTLLAPGEEHSAAVPRPPVLLLGVTGSGKTEIYLRATAEVLKRKEQALILVPEISLTPQTARRFAVRFPGQVGLWHSGMSEGQRYDTWRRVRSGDLSVVVGARSALFAPFRNLGLIVMDEEEDTSYKSGQAPTYHTRETAERLAGLHDALLLMGSATPSLEAYARAQSGRYRLLRLPARILSHQRRVSDWQRVLHLSESRYRPVEDAQEGAGEGGQMEAVTIPLPPVHVVDMRAELRAGNRSIFSHALQDAVDEALRQRAQVILYLNRRGSATYVFCRDCGWVAICPRCDIPLTQHRRVPALICHRCGYQRDPVRTCPTCGSGRVRAFGLGTEGLVTHVATRWPDARILRWDRDVARSGEAHMTIMRHFAQGDADILVGTQMVARGLDIPRVTVVGIVSADTALNLPDFRAAERTFQLLAQVAGRSGRGILGGQVVMQSYHPDHYAIQYAAAHDYEAFAEVELAFRNRAGYPPALRMARLLTADRINDKAQRAAEHLAERLLAALRAQGLPPTDLVGPAPAFFARVRGHYRWQILLRSVAPADFLRSIDLPPGWVVDIDPIDIL
jgi:primosomal protein N' (replication factor Y) (superfamily II helicase)